MPALSIADLHQVSLGFWILLALASLLAAVAITAVSYRVTDALAAVSDRIRRQLARDADTFGEPTREQVEAPWRANPGPWS